MNAATTMAKAAGVYAGVALTLFVMAGCKPAPQPAAHVAPAAAKPPTAPTETPKIDTSHISVFEDLLPPQGRDPFFPDSHRREPAPAPVVMAAARKAAVASDLLLKGIVGSATHRLAVINNAILEVGEESPVHVPGGQVRVRCVEIGEDYVVIKVDGEARPQKLIMEKKSY
jgi:hypothetical protein